MGIRWQRWAARFRSKLSLSDLHEATDNIYEVTEKEFPDLTRSLWKVHGADYGPWWRKEFSRQLETIAAQHTRKSQAAECRRLIVLATEAVRLAGVKSEFNEPIVSRMFINEAHAPEMTDEMIRAAAVMDFTLGVTDKTALVVLYLEQFNSMLGYQDFNNVLEKMCRLEAVFIYKEAAHSLFSQLDPKREGNSEQQHLEVIRPAFIEFEPIIHRYKENHCKLSPQKPDPTEFVEFSNKWLKVLEPFAPTPLFDGQRSFGNSG